MNRFVKAAWLGTAIVTLSATPAVAQNASFRVIGESAGVAGPCGTFDITSSGAVAAVGGCLSDPLGQARGAAGASNGQLAAESRANANVNGQFANWQTTAQFNDFVTFSSTDPNATTAIVSANLLFAGLFTVPVSGISTQSRLQGGGSIGSRHFSFLVQPNVGNTDIQLDGIAVVGGALSESSGLSFALLRTTAIEVALNVPIDFRLTIQNFALAVNAGANTVTDFASATSIANPTAAFGSASQGEFGTLNGNGVGLPIGIDAFELPTGVTVNAGTWLVNNRRISLAAPTVPEPASWAMMITGFGLIGGMLRRRVTKVSYA
jgi:PEP-CTERM motif